MKIRFQNVSKNYRVRIQNGLKGFFKPDFRVVEAVRDLNFYVEGGIVGLIGENGAGKSTTIKLLTGILSPNEGAIEVLGKNPFTNRKELMKEVGVIFGQRSLLRTTLPVKYTYEWLRDIYSVPKEVYQARLKDLTQLFGITDLIDRPPRELSLGQRRKCDLVAALLHGPKLLLLDEPTIGLDFKAKTSFRELLKTYVVKNDVTVLISSHDLTELENMCDEYLVLSRGRLVLSGSLEQLVDEIGLTNVVEFSVEGEDRSSELTDLGFDLRYEGSTLRIFYKEGVERIIKEVYDRFEVSDVRIEKNTLQKVLVD